MRSMLKFKFKALLLLITWWNWMLMVYSIMFPIGYFGVFGVFGAEDVESDQFSNYMLISGCEWDSDSHINSDMKVIKVLHYFPRVIVRCPPGLLTLQFHYGKLSDGAKQIPHYGPHRFTHIFINVQSQQNPNENENIIIYWKELYGRLYLTKFQYKFFSYKFHAFKKYNHYTPAIFQEDYWRSQWNQDKFIIQSNTETPDTELILNHLSYDVHLPTLLLQNRKSDLKEFQALFYNALSGWGGSRCKFNSRDEQIYELTYSYNSFDMMFCEAFKYHNLTFQTNYNFDNFFYMRHFLLRDDLVSSFPPESNALFYESPGITFIILKEPPLTWNNIARPFTPLLWALVILCTIFILCISKLIDRYLKGKENQITSVSSSITMSMSMLCLCRGADDDGFGGLVSNSNSNERESHDYFRDSEKVWSTSVGFFRLILISAYSGMILAGFINPSYPWSPKTFSELNHTDNYYAAIAYDSAVDSTLLKKSFLLNGIKNWLDRPSESEIEKVMVVLDSKQKQKQFQETLNNPGGFLPLDELDKEHRFALLMYNDKKHHYISSRHQLYLTYNFIHRLETDKEIVLPEKRYCSLAPGATKLHFILDSIRQIFETGVYLRWSYLEQNYFKYVAPKLVPKYGGPQIMTMNSLVRTLTLSDILTLVVLWAFGLVLCSWILVVENYREIIGHLVMVISLQILLLIRLFSGLSSCLEGIRNRLLHFNSMKIM